MSTGDVHCESIEGNTTEAESSRCSGLSSVPVKHTFIHFDDEDEQPQYRKTASTPAYVADLDRDTALPVYIPTPGAAASGTGSPQPRGASETGASGPHGPDEKPSHQKAAPAPALGRITEEADVVDPETPSTTTHSSSLGIDDADRCHLPSLAGVRVKHTFIHCDDDDDDEDQPDYRKTSSTPANFYPKDMGTVSTQPIFISLPVSREEIDPPSAASGSRLASGEQRMQALAGGPVPKAATAGAQRGRDARPEDKKVALGALETISEGPAWVPLPACADGQETDSSPGGRCNGRAELLEQSLPPVKHGFIHYDDYGTDEQPDYRTTKSAPGNSLSMNLEKVQTEPIWVPLRDAAASAEGEASKASDHLQPQGGDAIEAGDARGQQQQQPLPSPASAPPAGAAAGEGLSAVEQLSSVGSVGHTQGTCKPCAHAWKENGCSKGSTCTFCHLCTEDDFKRRRKEKLDRLKAERVMRRRGDEAERAPDAREQPPGGSGGGDPGGDVPGGAGGGRPSSAEAATSSGTGRGGGRGWMDLSLVGEPAYLSIPVAGGARGEQPPQAPAPGEVGVVYDGDDHTVIQWAIDLRKLRLQHRCGLTRKVTVQLNGRGTPFLFQFQPAGADSQVVAAAAPSPRASSFRKGHVLASIQLKCTDVAPLRASGKGRLRVAFGAAGLPLRWTQGAHDFAVEPVCALPDREALWDLSDAVESGACIVRAELVPAGGD